MADLYQSSLFEPSAPPERLLHKPATKKQPKIVSSLDRTAKEKTSPPPNSSRSPHALAPILEYFTKRRKINNNNNDNINNNTNTFNPEHSSKDKEACGDCPQPKAENVSRIFNFFRGKQTHLRSAAKKSTGDPSASEKEVTTASQIPEADAKQVENATPQDLEEMEVVYDGLLTKTESLGQKCFLLHLSHETERDADLGLQKSTDHELGVSLGAVGKSSDQTCSDVNEGELKHETFMDTTEIQEQLNSINLKRSKDAMMPQSIGSSATLPAHSESLSIPPVIEEVEESSVEEPPVIEVFLSQRESSPKQPSGIKFTQCSDGKFGTHDNVRKRRKLRHILRHLLSINHNIVKEDKQRLVEDDEDDEEEEEQATAETSIDGQEGRGDTKYSASKTPQTLDDTEAVTPETKKRRPGMKGQWRGWGHRVRCSMRRGCHYLGLGAVNITTYIIAEANFIGPVYPTTRNYDGEYIYTSYEYGINNYSPYYPY